MVGMPNITVCASSPPTPQPSTPMPLIIGVWLSVPIIMSGTAQVAPSRSCVVTTRGQLLQVDGVHDAGAGRVDAHAAQHAGGPAQKTIALRIAAHLVLQVERRRIRAGEGFDCERMVHRDIDRQHRVQHGRVDAGLGQRIAHRCDVDQRRRAGGVVHQHPAGLEFDFGFAAAVLQPREQGFDRCGALGAAHVAHHVFEQQAQHHRQELQARAKQRGQIDECQVPAVD